MTIELVNKKREELLVLRQQQLALQSKFLKALEETKANLHRVDGGLVECDYWIKKITTMEEEPEELGPVIEDKMEVVD